MKRRKIAASAALSLLASGVVGSGSHAQGADPVLEALDGNAPPMEAAGPEYVVEFEPFLEPVWTRMHEPPGVGKQESLFGPFDQLQGLSVHARNSRVSRESGHPVASVPVVEARVGETFDVPISVTYRDPITSLYILGVYDPDVLQIVDALGTGIPTEDIAINPKVVVKEKEYKGYLIAFTTMTTPWARGGPILRLRFKAIAPGVSVVRAAQCEVSDDKLVMIPAVMRPGLVRVKP